MWYYITPLLPAEPFTSVVYISADALETVMYPLAICKSIQSHGTPSWLPQVSGTWAGYLSRPWYNHLPGVMSLASSRSTWWFIMCECTAKWNNGNFPAYATHQYFRVLSWRICSYCFLRRKSWHAHSCISLTADISLKKGGSVTIEYKPYFDTWPKTYFFNPLQN